MAEVIDINSRRAERENPRPFVRVAKRVAETSMLPFLALASDDKYYWCKEINNPDGYESIINEIVASEIGSAIGAPIRTWEILDVPQELDRYRVEKRKTLKAGPVFGSLNIHGGDVDLMDRGIQFVDKDGNYQRIPKLIALWLLCNARELQVIFDHEDESRIYSIDHGLWFGSDNRMWEMAPDDMKSGQVSVPGLTLTIPSVQWDEAIDRVESLHKTDFSEIMEIFPNEWEVQEVEVRRLIDYAVRRKDYAIRQLKALKTRYTESRS